MVDLDDSQDGGSLANVSDEHLALAYERAAADSDGLTAPLLLAELQRRGLAGETL